MNSNIINFKLVNMHFYIYFLFLKTYIQIDIFIQQVHEIYSTFSIQTDRIRENPKYRNSCAVKNKSNICKTRNISFWRPTSFTFRVDRCPPFLPLHFHMVKGSVKQSDRNSSKMNVFHKLTSYEQQQQISFATDEYGQVGVFRIRMRSLLQKL